MVNAHPHNWFEIVVCNERLFDGLFLAEGYFFRLSETQRIRFACFVVYDSSDWVPVTRLLSEKSIDYDLSGSNT